MSFRLIILDACILAESAAEYYLDAGWQTCVVHFYRNVFSRKRCSGPTYAGMI